MRQRRRADEDEESSMALYCCELCNQMYRSRRALAIHRSLNHKDHNADSDMYNYTYNFVEENFVCNTCDAECLTLEEIQKHVETHEEKYMCKTCNEMFKDPFKFAVHNYSHDGDYYKCPFCTMKTTLRNSLHGHIKQVHLRKYSFVCKFCGKGFIDSVYLREHEDMHTKGTKFTCIVCNKDYPFSRYLQQHQIRNHRVNIEGVLLPNQCPICLKSYKKAYSLQKHMKVKHEPEVVREIKHLCDICGKNFSQGDKLRLHYRIHTGEKPYSCQYCDKSFTKKDYLVMHERIHSGEKPYSCEYCGKCFNQPAPLKIHIRGHTGEKPYVCHICTTGFSSKANLNAHFKKCNGV